MQRLMVAATAGVVLVGLIGCGPTNPDAVSLKGAGASFPAPLYDSWFKDYTAKTPDVTVDYQSVGSGQGVKDFTTGLVDFGASDAAMTDEEIAKVDAGVVMLPMTAGAVVLAYNLPNGPDELKLSREVYPKIFLGEITNWNDPAIASSNEGATLPDLPITVVHRADGSGTTYVFTKHLSTISEDFANGPGEGKTVEWPSDKGTFIGGSKNDGVTAQITQNAGAIGYIEYGYAKTAELAMASLENAAGNFVQPTPENSAAALASVEMPENLRAWVSDPSGDEAYPIVTYTWLLCYQKYEDPKKAAALKDLIEYCLTEGQKISDELGYIPLPQNVVDVVMEKAETIE